MQSQPTYPRFQIDVRGWPRGSFTSLDEALTTAAAMSGSYEVLRFAHADDREPLVVADDRSNPYAQPEDEQAETFIGIADMAIWDAFWAENGEAIREDEGLTHDVCLKLARNCSLMLGGGAAPLFRVGFLLLV